MSAALSLKHVNKSFGDKPSEQLIVLQNINLEIVAGEIFVIVGPSGSGKSTLLRIMSGLAKQDAGEVTLGPGLQTADFSFVFQQFALLPWLTVYQNVELGLLVQRLPEAKRQEIVYRELKQFGLEKFSQARLRELSGGMRQRVGLARALVVEPKIIFMDEPFSELDSFTAEELRQELLAVWSARRPTIILVTHLIEEALALADRVAVLTPRPGKIEKIVVNHLPRPRNPRSPEFFELEDKLCQLIKP